MYREPITLRDLIGAHVVIKLKDKQVAALERAPSASALLAAPYRGHGQTTEDFYRWAHQQADQESQADYDASVASVNVYPFIVVGIENPSWRTVTGELGGHHDGTFFYVQHADGRILSHLYANWHDAQGKAIRLQRIALRHGDKELALFGRGDWAEPIQRPLARLGNGLDLE